MTTQEPPTDPPGHDAEPPDPGEPVPPPFPGQTPPSPPYPGQTQPYPFQPYPGQPGFAQPPDPSAPFGRHPTSGEPYSDKQKLVAGLLQIFLGGFGAGRWYLGYTGIALAQLLTCGGLGIWALIDGIQILMGSVRDPQGRPLRD